MKKEKPINLAARMLAEQRWKDVTPAERQEHQRRAAQTPRTAKRCFCGATSMWNAANRYFDCCRRAGVVVLNLQVKKTNGEAGTGDPETTATPPGTTT